MTRPGVGDEYPAGMLLDRALQRSGRVTAAHAPRITGAESTPDVAPGLGLRPPGLWRAGTEKRERLFGAGLLLLGRRDSDLYASIRLQALDQLLLPLPLTLLIGREFLCFAARLHFDLVGWNAVAHEISRD